MLCQSVAAWGHNEPQKRDRRLLSKIWQETWQLAVRIHSFNSSAGQAHVAGSLQWVPQQHNEGQSRAVRNLQTRLKAEAPLSNTGISLALHPSLASLGGGLPSRAGSQ